MKRIDWIERRADEMLECWPGTLESEVWFKLRHDLFEVVSKYAPSQEVITAERDGE